MTTGGILTVKAGTPQHVMENRAAIDLRLPAADRAEPDRVFPPPRGPQPLAMY
jgi:diketogulonate reductase-like aldo/keto reductase